MPKVNVDFVYFLDARELDRYLTKQERLGMIQDGKRIMRTARRSLRRGRRYIRIEQLPTPELRRKWTYIQYRRRGEGRPPSPLPRRPSKPGRPPRIKYRSSPLKRLLLFGYIPKYHEVWIGPRLFDRRDVPGILEFGGTSEGIRIRPRPFMGPALDKHINDIGPYTGR